MTFGKRTIALSCIVLASMLVSGCGHADPGEPQTAQPTTSAGATEPAPSAPALGRPVSLTDKLIVTTLPRIGKVVTDEGGWVLYRFDMDVARPSKSNCEAKCTEVWRPAFTDGNPKLSGIEPTTVGMVLRFNGTRQLTLGGWPLYRYLGDTKPGELNGHGASGAWFVVTPEGQKNLTNLPSKIPSPAAPPIRSPTRNPRNPSPPLNAGS